MAGKLSINQLQLGDSATATQNFTLQSNVDGTAKLARGNAGATTQDILTVDAAGKITAPQGYNDVLGSGQTWQDVAGSRVLGTTYTNSTGKPIVVSVTTNSTTSAGVNITVSGLLVTQGSGWASSGGQAYGSCIIPVGATYSVTVSSGTGTILNWKELR